MRRERKNAEDEEDEEDEEEVYFWEPKSTKKRIKGNGVKELCSLFSSRAQHISSPERDISSATAHIDHRKVNIDTHRTAGRNTKVWDLGGKPP